MANTEPAENATPTSQKEDEASTLLFSCRCESAKTISTLLSCLKHVGAKTSDYAMTNGTSIHPTTLVTVYCTPSSLTFHVHGKAQTCQASVDMPSGLFSEYVVRDNGDEEWQAGGEFCINLQTLLDCFHILGSSVVDATRASFSYDLEAEIFRMELLHEDNILSTAAIPGVVLSTSPQSSNLALAFRSGALKSRILLVSAHLKEGMAELDLVQGASTCSIALSPEAGLEVAAVGHAGECLVTIPPSMAISLETTEQAVSYPLHSFQSGLRALDIAQETCISINENGMMAIQHQVIIGGNSQTPSFVDFIMSCLEDQDNDDQEAAINNNPVLRSQDESTWETDNDSTQRMDSNEGDSNNEEEKKEAASALQQLFGTVVEVRPSQAETSASTATSKRKKRRKQRSIPQPEASDTESEALLDEAEEEPINVAETSLHARRHRRDRSHSPEVGYGEELTQDDF